VAALHPHRLGVAQPPLAFFFFSFLNFNFNFFKKISIFIYLFLLRWIHVAFLLV
jgi:hypothetical protein